MVLEAGIRADRERASDDGLGMMARNAELVGAGHHDFTFFCRSACRASKNVARCYAQPTTDFGS
jgi:hypothetical protein